MDPYGFLWIPLNLSSAIAAIQTFGQAFSEVRRLRLGDGLVPLRDGCVWVVLAEMMWIGGPSMNVTLILLITSSCLSIH